MGQRNCFERRDVDDEVGASVATSGRGRSRFIQDTEVKIAITLVYKFDSNTLGCGSYGTVTKGTHKKSGAVRAIKAMRKSTNKCEMEALKQEITIMKMMDHPNTIKLHESFEDARKNYLVMDLCTGGELFDRIVHASHFNENDAAIVMKQIFAGVNYLHSMNICHRDLKPENFLFSSGSSADPVTCGTLKLIDFGLSKIVPRRGFMTTKTGTPFYVAPEVLEGKYALSSDIWSVGVILYVLLSGSPPFAGRNDAEVLASVKKGKYDLETQIWSGVSSDGKDLIKRILITEPRKRITAPQSLNHRWMLVTAPKSTAQLGDNMLYNIRGFKDKCKFKQAALQVIAGQMDEEKLNELREIFISLDLNGDGVISAKELKDGLSKAKLVDFPQDFKQLMAQMDCDNSGTIDYTEFLAATMDRRMYMQEDVMRGAFAVFDLNGDGKITPAELKQILSNGDVTAVAGAETLQRLLKDVDANNDGVIDFEEFMAMMRGQQGYATFCDQVTSFRTKHTH